MACPPNNGLVETQPINIIWVFGLPPQAGDLKRREMKPSLFFKSPKAGGKANIPA